MKCETCGNRYSEERKRVTVQYLSGDYDECRPCVDRRMEEGTIIFNMMDFLVGRRMFYKGFVSTGVYEYIKRVFDERTRVAS